MRQSSVDALFQSCRDGILDCQSVTALRHITLLRDIDNRSLLDVAIQCKHGGIVRQLFQYDFMPPVAAKTAALENAAASGDYHIFKMIYGVATSTGTGISSDASAVASMLAPATTAASAHGHISILRYILSNHPDHDQLDLNGAFLEACRHNQVDVVRELIRVGCEAHLIRSNALTMAICANKCASDVDMEPLIDLLNNAGAFMLFTNALYWYNDSARNNTSLTNHHLSLRLYNDINISASLYMACVRDRGPLIDHLLSLSRDEGYDVGLPRLIERVFNRRSVCMGSGIYNGVDVHVLYRLLVEYEKQQSSNTSTSNAAMTNSHNNTIPINQLLIYASAANHVDMVRPLLDTGECDVNAVVRGTTALSQSFDPAVIKLLLDANADVNLKSSDPLLSAACRRLRHDAVMMLLEASAGAGDADKRALATTSLSVTVSAPCTDRQADDKIAIINLLLDSGAGTRDSHGDSVLGTCLRLEPAHHNVTAMQTLMQRDPSLLVLRDSNNQEPLMYAISRCPPVMIKTLIDAGADVSIVDIHGRSVFQRIFDKQRQGSHRSNPREKRDILRLLLDAGADPMACIDKCDITLPMWIVSESHEVPDYAISILIGDMFDHFIDFGAGAFAPTPLD